MSRVLITGGVGFIGSHVSEALLKAGHQVSIIDDLNDYYDPILKWRNLAEIGGLGNIAFHRADIRDAAAVERVFQRERPEAVLHLAARAGVRPSLADPALYYSTNVGGTLVLLEAMRRHRVRKLVFASSSSVYGDRAQVPFRESDVVARPISPYAATKLAGEQLVHTYTHLYGLRAVCLRFFTAYGPRQRPDLAIRQFYERIRAGRTITLFGDGSSGRDYTYISDIANGVKAALYCDVPYEILNLGSSHPVLLRDVVEGIGRVLDVVPRVKYEASQPGDVSITYADNSKAESLLGYRPRVEFAEGLERFHRWYEASFQDASRSLALVPALAGAAAVEEMRP